MTEMVSTAGTPARQQAIFGMSVSAWIGATTITASSAIFVSARREDGGINEPRDSAAAAA